MKYVKYGKTKKKFIAFLFITIFLFSSYIAGASYIINDIISEITEGEIDDSNFIEPDLSLMENMSNQFEFYLERDNIPLNYTLTAIWKDTNFTEIEYYRTAGDAAIWTGMMLGSESFHYAVAKRSGNETARLDALRMVKKILTGVKYLLAVPNGGIGPEYDATLARSVWSPDYSGPRIHEVGPEEAEERPLDVFNGTGHYSNWYWKGYPSTDQNCGIIFGITRCAILVAPDDPWVANLTSLMSQQYVEYYLRTNWMLTDGNIEGGRRTTGQEFKISVENSGYWALSILKMAQLANPGNNRYNQLYYHYAYERNYAQHLKPRANLGIFQFYNYYTLNLQWVIMFNLAESETDPYLRRLYQETVENYFYSITKTSRNAWFNIAYLGMMGKNDSFIARDIADQIMRFSIDRFPSNITRVPDRGGAMNPYPPEQIGRPKMEYWRNFLENNTVGKVLYGWWLLSFMFNDDPSRLLISPKTVDQYHAEDFLFQRNPWVTSNNSTEYLEYTARRQDSGLSFLLPYYMSIYYNIWEGL